MSHARAWVPMLGVLVVAAAAACGMDGFEVEPDVSTATDGGRGGATDGEQTPGVSTDGPTSDGVLILHTASFPAFRLCFEAYMDQPPQPDSAVMPQANVVGVEVGSLVRIGPLTRAPGKVYVVREEKVRAQPGESKACKDFIQRDPETGADLGALREGSEYIVAGGKLDAPIGVNQAEVLAIGGCGPQLTLNALDRQAPGSTPNTAACGEGWNPILGNASAFVVPLETTNDKPTDVSLPVQLYDMAPAVAAMKGQLAVTFGDTEQPGETVGIGALRASGVRATLDVDQADQASYGKRGFAVDVTLPDSGAALRTSQTLADIQQLSAPKQTPTAYYRSASNYALLLVGDPSHASTLADGGANTAYNERRGLHFLAVPVLDPTRIDAGADAGDAGVP